MDIRVIDDTSYESAKILWSICFPEDQGPFLDYYFSRRTSPKMVAAAFEKEKMIAGMHIIPQRIKIGGTEKPVAFVAGVATLPEFRNRGVITRVLNGHLAIWPNRGFKQPFYSRLIQNSTQNSVTCHLQKGLSVYLNLWA